MYLLIFNLNSVFFKKKKESSGKKLDKLVTSIIIWWTVASMIGLSQTQKWKEVTKNIKEEWKKVAWKSVELLWKTLAKIVSMFDKKK